MPWMSPSRFLADQHTFLPALVSSTAFSEVKTACPEAAPGEAGRPLVMTGSFFHSAGSNTGASSCDSASGSTSRSASRGFSSFSATKSVAMRTAA